jgi:hypothetical protein
MPSVRELQEIQQRYAPGTTHYYSLMAFDRMLRDISVLLCTITEFAEGRVKMDREGRLIVAPNTIPGAFIDDLVGPAFAQAGRELAAAYGLKVEP